MRRRQTYKMKKESTALLADYIKKQISKKEVMTEEDFALRDLFKKYCSNEGLTLESIHDASYSFFYYFNKHKNDIMKHIKWKTAHDIYGQLGNMESAIYDPYDNFITEGEPYQSYVNVVRHFITPNTRLLDVGAGAVPFSSITLAESAGRVDSMDKFYVDEKFLKRYKVYGHDKYFDSSTDISSYDIVVGNRPCTAIGDIVESCVKQNKPYIIRLCQCEVEKFAKKRYPDAWYKPERWEDILPDFDSKVKFYSGFAFNVDASVDQFRQAMNVPSLDDLQKFDEFIEGLASIAATGIVGGMLAGILEEMKEQEIIKGGDWEIDDDHSEEWEKFLKELLEDEDEGQPGEE